MYHVIIRDNDSDELLLNTTTPNTYYNISTSVSLSSVVYITVWYNNTIHSDSKSAKRICQISSTGTVLSTDNPQSNTIK